jgi:threonine dehydrogenase-like Zn-dependent dehydrogenase
MTTRRSTGKIKIARALWYSAQGKVEIRSAPLPPLAPDHVEVRTLFSGVSRGTERLVLSGLVPRDEWERMRAPRQEGAFPFPVKYGYCATGIVEAGPKDRIGRAVFCLHPHQDIFQVPFSFAVPLPNTLPPRRATLAANMETALNAHWDAGTGPGDRVVVVGAGIVGLLVAFIAARLPGTEVTVLDRVEARRPLVEALGARFDVPATTGGSAANADVVFHTSASQAGLATAIAAAGFEATVVEMSWYGDKSIAVPLGGAFHSQRLRLVSSQVGNVSAGRRARWDFRRRMEAALRLLADPVLDALLTTEIAFDEAPAKLPALLAPDAPGLAPVIRYEK